MSNWVRRLGAAAALLIGLMNVAHAVYVDGNPLSYTDPEGLVKEIRIRETSSRWKAAPAWAAVEVEVVSQGVVRGRAVRCRLGGQAVAQICRPTRRSYAEEAPAGPRTLPMARGWADRPTEP
jgi:hypothetical protein